MTARMRFTAYVEGPEMGRVVRSRLLELCAAENVVGVIRTVLADRMSSLFTLTCAFVSSPSLGSRRS